MTERVNYLAQLIRSRCDALGINYSDVARRGKTHRQTVARLANPDFLVLRMPSPETLEALAAGLGVALSVVHEAAARSAGLIVDDHIDEMDRMVITSLRALTPAEKRQVAEYATFIAKQRPKTAKT